MPEEPQDILKAIAAYKREEVRELKRTTSIDRLTSIARFQKPALGFADHLKKISRLRPAIIAEVKKASPSKSVIRHDFDPVAIAEGYAEGGAACLSVLTDGPSFQGSVEIFKSVRRVSKLPMLRKDFILDPIQVLESRGMGADAILVIMAMLDDRAVRQIMFLADELGMDVLVETHTAEEIQRALNVGARIIGINNRNLKTFETTLDNFDKLSSLVPATMPLIAESGISSRGDIQFLTRLGATGFLIGESLMRRENVEIGARYLSGA
ncbi:indole-3-glycerol phosphate synthase [Litorimonas taeanensis]|uniref:Indole-3-glycerol phosphate synthase n=1 Tax=Litorimonas taeanensis TaxID=568099 RepID=A0A420WJU6_9PROT|nr:indole-3-glycerol phosphate synthase TrpC [Litorimonas taeanensis]RKQ71196.1 indole-3-glycerol phosphate synthase [Litorimonas taeanensis]